MDGIGWLGVFVAALGIVALLWGLSVRSRANTLVAAAGQWPTAPGTMIAAEVLKGGTSRNPTYTPAVRYEYEVGGRKYVGDRLRPGYLTVGWRGTAERMIQPYPVGAAVAVRYDPDDPGSSLLELQTSSSPMVAVVLGAVLILMGGGIVVAAMAGVFSRHNVRSGSAATDVARGLAVDDRMAAASSAGSAGPETRTWRGSYSCGQGETGLEVTLRSLGQDRLEGTMSFFPLPTNPGVPRGCYRVTGQADAATRTIQLRGGEWVRQPPGYHVVDLSGRIGADHSISGQVLSEGCGQFQLRSVAAPAESCSGQ
jgi:hypothetical protein